MTPPEAPEKDADAPAGIRSPAVSVCARDTGARLVVLRKRADFLAAARALRQGAGSMSVQARRRDPTEADGFTGIRVGYTCSKKVGNAVARNRAKRRLRAAAQAVLTQNGQPGWDYVLIGRPEATAARPYAALLDDLAGALARLHDPAFQNKPRPPRDTKRSKGRGAAPKKAPRA